MESFFKLCQLNFDKTERKGFEPSVRITHIDLAGLHLKPLGHLSLNEGTIPLFHINQRKTIQKVHIPYSNEVEIIKSSTWTTDISHLQGSMPI